MCYILLLRCIFLCIKLIEDILTNINRKFAIGFYFKTAFLEFLQNFGISK